MFPQGVARSSAAFATGVPAPIRLGAEMVTPKHPSNYAAKNIKESENCGRVVIFVGAVSIDDNGMDKRNASLAYLQAADKIVLTFLGNCLLF